MRACTDAGCPSTVRRRRSEGNLWVSILSSDPHLVSKALSLRWAVCSQGIWTDLLWLSYVTGGPSFSVEAVTSTDWISESSKPEECGRGFISAEGSPGEGAKEPREERPSRRVEAGVCEVRQERHLLAREG